MFNGIIFNTGRVQDIIKKKNSIYVGIQTKINLSKLIQELNRSKKPLLIIGNGLKQSKTEREFKKFVKKYKIPFVTSRFALDLFPYSMKENMGLLGIKGTLFGEKLIKECDLVISLGCRLAPTLTFGSVSHFTKNKKIFSSMRRNLKELKALMTMEMVTLTIITATISIQIIQMHKMIMAMVLTARE